MLALGGCKTQDSQTMHSAAMTAARHDDHGASSVAPDQALMMLRDGNARYVAGKPTRPNQSVDRRAEVAGGQHPYAVVLTCSDSRVPPEMIFDAGLGDLFVVRVAGNTADDAAIGSIEYAVEHLGATLIVVMGHDKCGAVKAAVDGADSTTPAPGHLPAVVGPIADAVKQTKGKNGDPLDLAIRANVANVVQQLKTSKPVLGDRVSEGKLQVIGACYHLDNGVAEMK
jgi:carbonic anhydrase